MKKFTLFFAALMTCTLSFAQTTYEKVTAAPTDWSGEYLLVYENSSTEAYVWTGVDAISCYTSATIADGKITAEGLVTITIDTTTTVDSYSIKVNGGTNDGKYISGTNGSNKLIFENTAAGNTLSVESDGVKIVSNTSVMRFNSAKDNLRFRYFQAKTYTAQKAVQLYKKAGAAADIPATAITLDKTTTTLDKGATVKLTATLTPADATTEVVWATENAEIATVEKGLVTAVGVGTTNITATVTPAEGTTFTATCAVTVTEAKPVDGMNYSVDFTNTAEAKTWTIDNKEIGSLTEVWSQSSSYGYIGSAYVNKQNNAAESWLVSPKLDLSKAEVATMTVNHALNFLNGKANTLMVKGTKDGETWVDLTVNGWPEGNSWTYMDGTVDLTSVISATTQVAFVYKSTTEVAPTWEIKKVTVEGSEAVHATGVSLSMDTLTTELHKYTQLTATLTPEGATDLVTWASDNEKVATVSATGVVTAVSVGSAKITATAGSASATCAVVVTEATPITCAQAVEIAKTVETNNVAAAGGMYVIRGFVTALEGTPSDDMKTYRNYSVWMADTKDGGKVFEAYQVKPIDGTTIAAVGDYVEVVGDITKYTKDEDTTYETVGKGAATIKVLGSEGTAVEDIKAETGKAVKVIENGQLIIIRDNVRYNAVGTVIE